MIIMLLDEFAEVPDNPFDREEYIVDGESNDSKRRV